MEGKIWNYEYLHRSIYHLNNEYILKGNIQHMCLINISLCKCFYSIKSRFVRYATSACACIMCLSSPSLQPLLFLVCIYILGSFKSTITYSRVASCTTNLKKIKYIPWRRSFFCALVKSFYIYMLSSNCSKNGTQYRQFDSP